MQKAADLAYKLPECAATATAGELGREGGDPGHHKASVVVSPISHTTHSALTGPLLPTWTWDSKTGADLNRPIGNHGMVEEVTQNFV